MTIHHPVRPSQPIGEGRANAGTSRQARILRWLAEDGRLDVISLARRLGVAQETVRRDLKALEVEGQLQRVHGGAVPVEAQPFAAPILAPSGPADRALATALWARLPRTGTILLGGGPLVATLVAVLSTDPPPRPGLTLVTNSLDVSVTAAQVVNVAVYNIGGTVSPATRLQEGDWALHEMSRLQVDVSVVCPAGLSIEHGLGQLTPAAAAVSEAAVKCGQSVIALADSAAVDRAAFVRFATWAEIDTLMVPGDPGDAGAFQAYRAQGVEVVITPTTAVEMC